MLALYKLTTFDRIRKWKGRPGVSKQYIGIMVGSSFFNKMLRGRPLPILTFYEEAGVIHDITPCYFQLKDLIIGMDWISALVKNPNGNGYLRMTVPRPKVIHNRGYHSLKVDKEKIKSLQREGITFFNDWNSYGKLQIDRILREQSDLVPFLPETYRFNHLNMQLMMKKHRELMIKPNKGSLGKRNMKITRNNETEWVLAFPSGSKQCNETFTTDVCPNRLTEIMESSNYLIQERIPLAEYNGAPFDIRVSVQRNRTGEWQITGMVAKVAKAGNFVTNVARGGACFPLSEIIKNFPHLHDSKVRQSIEHLAILTVKQLESHLPNLADLGLDIGITHEGFPMFIECNARDLRYSFEQAGLLAEWEATYSTPICYGKYLLDLQDH